MSEQIKGGGEQPRPHLVPTAWSTLVITALVAGFVGWIICRQFYGDLPAVPWFGSFVLVGLAAVEFISGRTIRARIEHKPGMEPVEPLTVAMSAALAKASSLMAAAYGGVMTGVTVWLLSKAGDVDAAARDLPYAGLGVLAGACLLAAALFLENSCRIPPGSDEGSTDVPESPSR